MDLCLKIWIKLPIVLVERILYELTLSKLREKILDCNQTNEVDTIGERNKTIQIKDFMNKYYNKTISFAKYEFLHVIDQNYINFTKTSKYQLNDKSGNVLFNFDIDKSSSLQGKFHILTSYFSQYHLSLDHSFK